MFREALFFILLYLSDYDLWIIKSCLGADHRLVVNTVTDRVLKDCNIMVLEVLLDKEFWCDQ